MKKLKTTILGLCLILIGVSVIFCVSAVDNNTIVFNETDNTANSINTTNDGVVVSNATTFQELQQDINKYDSIELAHDIKRDGSQTIEINKTVIINAKGHTINGEKAQIFFVKTTGNLTLKNINIINGVGDDTGKGGAISNEGELTITGSTFNDNSAKNYGGVIYNHYTGTLTITGSTFKNNEAYYGGAIYNGGTLTITGSTLNNNQAKHTGGAIHNSGTLTITGSTLNNNQAKHTGGAIHNSGTFSIDHSTLTNNKVLRDGGAIFNIGYMDIKSALIDGKLVNYSGKGNLP